VKTFKAARFWQLLFSFVGVISFSMPFWGSQPASLQFNTYDLSEWATLSPETLNILTGLNIAFMLRLALVGTILQLLLTLLRFDIPRQWYLVIAFIGGVLLLPPMELFVQSHNDPNYRQQFMLAIICWFGTAIIKSQFAKRHRYAIQRLIAVLVMVCSIVGAIMTGITLRLAEGGWIFGVGFYLTASSVIASLMVIIAEQKT
jgi:hypothetical protein